MKEAQTAQQPLTYATVPLRRVYLRQPAMLDPWYANKSYSLPLVAPGQEALIIDADYEWEMYNGRRGTVIVYSFFTGLHTIEVDGVWPTVFLGREIMKGR